MKAVRGEPSQGPTKCKKVSHFETRFLQGEGGLDLRTQQGWPFWLKEMTIKFSASPSFFEFSSVMELARHSRAGGAGIAFHAFAECLRRMENDRYCMYENRTGTRPHWH